MATDTHNCFENFNTIQVDCIICLMLKILDGKCKMIPEEKVIIEALYDQVCALDSDLLGEKHHALIGLARKQRDHSEFEGALREKVYEERLFAETMISRPVMKHFKAWLRENAYLPQKRISS